MQNGPAMTGLAALLAAVVLTAPEFLLVPLAVLLGSLTVQVGFATRVHGSAAVLLRGRRGSLPVAAMLGCAGFAATTGSSVACAATMSRIAIPAMLRAGHDARLAGTSVATATTLGALLPPPMLLILWALLTGTPMAQTFLAPLLLAALSLMGMVAVTACWIWSDPAAAMPGRVLTVSRRQALEALWPASVLSCWF